MSVSRRGFLQTLAASLVGAATFDPVKALWVPEAKPLVSVPLTLTNATPAAVEKAAALVIEQQAELQQLAMWFAQRMTERLDRHPSIALREVMYRHTGNAHLGGLIDIPGEGTKAFVPGGRVMATAAGQGWKERDVLAGQLAGNAWNFDAFAPISAELRPGEPFSDTLVGVATDPDSGLSVRVLRFDVDRRRGTETMTGVEMAGGNWAKNRVVDRKTGISMRYNEFFEIVREG